MTSSIRLGWLGIAGAAIVFVSANLAMHPLPNTYLWLAPWPDGPQYLDAARALVEEGRYHVHVAGREVPPRFPMGYSLLLAAAYRAGVPLLTCPLWVNLFFALACLGLLAVFFARRGLWTEAGLAVLLLATGTSFNALTRSPLSDIPGGFFLLAGATLLYGAAIHGTRRLWMTACSILGLALSIRWGFLLLYGLIPAAALAGWRKAGSRTLALAALALAAGAAPLFVYQYKTFGSMLATGYSYWLPDAGTSSGAFGLKYIPMQTTALWEELIQREPGPSTAHLYGGGSYFAPSFVLLAGIALWTLRRRREVVLFSIPCVVYVALLLAYFSVDMRLYYPLVLLAIPVAAVGIPEAWRRASRPGRAALGLLVAVALIGLPGARSATDLGDILRTPNLHVPVPEWETVRTYNENHGRAGALLLTDMDPVYVHVLTGGERTVVPLQNNHDYSYNPASFRYGDSERAADIESALRNGIPVLALTGRKNLDALEPIAGRVWHEEFRNSAGGGVAILAGRERPSSDYNDRKE